MAVVQITDLQEEVLALVADVDKIQIILKIGFKII